MKTYIYKKIFPFILSIALIACSNTTLHSFDSEKFSIDFDETWYTVTDYSDIPELSNKNILFVIFKRIEGKLISFNIVQETLETDIENEGFTNKNIQNAESLNNYELIDTSKITVSDYKSTLHNYYASNSKREKVEYLQTFLYSGKDSYVLTGASVNELDAETITEIQSIMRSFTLKDVK